MIKGRPPRLDLIYSGSPIFFVTFCTRHRRRLGSLDLVQDAFEVYASKALADFNVAVGRYVIMPDYIHLFVRGDDCFELSQWVGGLKRAISVALQIRRGLWQPGFFDHVLRSDESYGQKWEYVRDNPVRAALVAHREEWKYQGEVVLVDRV